jgi:hypothetical protein
LIASSHARDGDARVSSRAPNISLRLTWDHRPAVPEAIGIGRRSVRTICQNLGATALSNAVGLGPVFLAILLPIGVAVQKPAGQDMRNAAHLLRPA